MMLITDIKAVPAMVSRGTMFLPLRKNRMPLNAVAFAPCMDFFAIAARLLGPRCFGGGGVL